MTDSQYETLLKINLDDLVSSFGWENKPILPRVLQRIFLRPAKTFAHQMMEFDQEVGRSGLVEGARYALRKYFNYIRFFGVENLPKSGFLALSNHPGMSDSLSTFIALNRPDLKIIALQRPFLEALTHLSKHLFYVKEDPAARLALTRHVSSFLRQGGSVLTYPAGRIEPWRAQPRRFFTSLIVCYMLTSNVLAAIHLYITRVLQYRSIETLGNLLK